MKKAPTRRRDSIGMASISAIAEEFDMSRDTVRRRLSEAGTQSAGERDGHPVYAIGAAMQALFPSQIALCPHCGRSIART